MPPTKGALPPAALRLAPPRSPRGRGAGRAAYGLLTCPPCLSVCRFVQRQGFGFAHVLTRSVLGLRPALRCGFRSCP